MGVEGAGFLATSLAVNQSLLSLQLEGNEIGPVGLKLLSEGLKVNCTLLSLKLGNNSIGGDLSSLVMALLEHESQSGITALSLGSNNLRAEGSKWVAKLLSNNVQSAGGVGYCLLGIKLGDNEMGTEGAKMVALALSGGESEGPAGFTNSLSALDLSTNGIGYEGAVAFQQLLSRPVSLSNLRLCDNDMGDAGVNLLEGVVQSDRLELDMSGNSDSDSASGQDTRLHRNQLRGNSEDDRQRCSSSGEEPCKGHAGHGDLGSEQLWDYVAKSPAQSATTITPTALTAFYRQYNPSKIGDVELIIEQYSPENLLQALVKEYGLSTTTDFFDEFGADDDIYGTELHDEVGQEQDSGRQPLSRQALLDEELRRATEGLPAELLSMLHEN
jgi:Ran GTPase-activating protein (RanGAP) involved in mRNA processing and transport